MKLSSEDFHLLRDYINERTGIYLREEKAYFLENRLDVRLRELGFDDVKDYYRLLKYGPNGAELDTFVEMLTTNETFFFRDVKQLNAFSQEALPLVMAKKRERNERTLTIWSAGCSTGEEAYTLAMLARETDRDMNVKVYATDINARVIAKAKEGVYRGRTMKDVPAYYLTKYFIPRNDGLFEIAPPIRDMVDFMTLNLIDRTRMKLIFDVDFIFCRNVLIYFEHSVARQVIGRFYGCLRQGGFIFLGLAESMHLFSGAFTLVKFRELFGYRKE